MSEGGGESERWDDIWPAFFPVFNDGDIVDHHSCVHLETLVREITCYVWSRTGRILDPPLEWDIRRSSLSHYATAERVANEM